MYWLLVLLITLVIAIHIHILYSDLKFDLYIALQDAVISTIILSLSLWGIILMITAYPTTAVIYLYSLFIAFILSGATVYTQYEALKWWFPDTNIKYRGWLKDTLPFRFLFILLFNSWMATNIAMRKILTLSESRFQQQTDASVLLKEAELFKLRQQLQPHFLYNSLNSINTLIITAPGSAQEMIGKLSDFLRSSVKRESEDLLNINDELNYLQSYLDIESVRFGDRLKVNFDNNFRADTTIPPFLLQPIIENAVKFGLYGKTGNVTINVSIKTDGQLLKIVITNPYDKDAQPPRGTGFGLEGIKRRLWLIYARSDLLETQKDDNYFTTILKIPQSYV